jgi:hypothetical protein
MLYEGQDQTKLEFEFEVFEGRRFLVINQTSIPAPLSRSKTLKSIMTVVAKCICKA